MGIYGSNTYVYFTDNENSQFIIHLRIAGLCDYFVANILDIYFKGMSSWVEKI